MSHVRAARLFTAAGFLLGGVLLFTGQASAHVNYGASLFSDSSIIDPVTGALGTGIVNATPNRTVSSNAGWVSGLNAQTGTDSHNNRFLYFNLAQAMTIDFTITGTDTNGNGVLNPGYSIFSGYAVSGAHDGANYAGQTPFATWSPFATSPAGSSPTSQKWGEYRSNANFTLANNSGAVSTLLYTGLSGSNSIGNAVTGRYELGPGVYSLVVGGANATDYMSLLSNAMSSNSSGTAYTNDRLARTFNIEFSVAPVPIPAAVWLFGSGLAGVVALTRRRLSA